MKRICVGLLTVCLFVTCGCSGSTQKQRMYVVNGAYNLTPQEYIDLSNQFMESQKDGEYFLIPDWDTAEANKVYVTESFYISFKVNDEGKITRILYQWRGLTEESYSAAFLIGATMEMISPGNGDIISEQLDLFNSSEKSIDNNYAIDGSLFYYTSLNYRRAESFSVYVIE